MPLPLAMMRAFTACTNDGYIYVGPCASDGVDAALLPPSCSALPVYPLLAMHASVAGMLGKTGSKKTIVLGSPICRSAHP